MSRWDPPARGWQHELIEKLPSGVDLAQIAANLKLTPTERLEKMLRFQRELEEMRDAFGEQRRRSR